MAPVPSTARLRRAATVLSAVAVGASLALTSAPAHADVPEGWSEPDPVGGLHALMVFLGGPLLLFVLIAVAVYLPSMVRGEPLLPDHGEGEAQWLGGPGTGTRELPAPDDEDSRAGGASGSW